MNRNIWCLVLLLMGGLLNADTATNRKNTGDAFINGGFGAGEGAKSSLESPAGDDAARKKEGGYGKFKPKDDCGCSKPERRVNPSKRVEFESRSRKKGTRHIMGKQGSLGIHGSKDDAVLPTLNSPFE